MSSQASNINSWIGLTTVLWNKRLAVFNSSALLPNPVLSLIPINIGEVTLWATINLRILSSAKNWYCSLASDNCTGSILAAISLLSLNAKMNLPELLEPLNFCMIRLSISSRSSSVGTPLLKLINILGDKPFLMLLMW